MSAYGLSSTSSSSSPFSTSSTSFSGFCSGNNRRPSMFTAKYRQREERKKVLKLSLNKVKRIEDPESFLCRSVLINNTIKRLQREVREEKMMRHGGSGGYFSKLSMHSSFRKSFTSSPSRLSDLHRLCAPPEDLMDDDDGPMSLLSPVSPPPPPTIIIPNLPCISTTTTSFTSSTPSSTTCNQLVDPLSSHLGNGSGRGGSASDNDNSEFCNGNGVSSTNSRKRALLSDDEDDSCDVLSQIYIPPTPCIISAIDEDNSKDRLDVDACDSTSLSGVAANTAATMESSSLGVGNSKKPRLSLLSDDDEDHCVSSSTSHGITFNGNVVIDSSCPDTPHTHNSALTDSSASPAAVAYDVCTSSTYATAALTPAEVTSSSCGSVATMGDVDDDDVDIDIDVVGDCETSDWPTLPIHYDSSISSKNTTTIITTTPATLVTNTTTMTTNSCLIHHLPLIHQYSLDDELDLSASSADALDSTPEGSQSAAILEYKSGGSSGDANREITSSFDDEDELSLLDNTKENTCTLPQHQLQLLSCSSSAASYSTGTSTGVNNNNTCSSSSPFYCSPAAGRSEEEPQSLHNKCAVNSFMSVCNSFNNNSNCGTINCNNNNSPNMEEDSNSADSDKQQHQPPPSPSQYSSCGHSTIFSELQSTVFHSLITSLET